MYIIFEYFLILLVFYWGSGERNYERGTARICGLGSSTVGGHDGHVRLPIAGHREHHSIPFRTMTQLNKLRKEAVFRGICSWVDWCWCRGMENTVE